jgi:hypothetical protein
VRKVFECMRRYRYLNALKLSTDMHVLADIESSDFLYSDSDLDRVCASDPSEFAEFSGDELMGSEGECFVIPSLCFLGLGHFCRFWVCVYRYACILYSDV